MGKGKKENTDKLAYPHPILRSLSSIEQQSLTYSPCSYQTFHTVKSSTLSAKILRPSHTWPLFAKPFSVLLHPFHPGVQVQELNSHSLASCKKCGAYLTVQNRKTISLVEAKCSFCQTINHLEPHIASQTESPGVFDLPSSEATSKKILLMIEINQRLFETKVHQTVCQCLTALQTQQAVETKQQKSFESCLTGFTTQPESSTSNEQFQFGLVLFDADRVYAMDLRANQVVICDPTNFQNQFPLNEEELFCPLSQIKIEELEEILEKMMYEGFQRKQSCLAGAINMIASLKNFHQFKICSFIYSLNAFCEGQDPKREKLKIPSNMHTFLVIKDQSIRNQIAKFHKIYDYHYFTLEKDMYYDIFHCFTQEVHYNVEVKVKTHKSLKCIENQSKIASISSNNSLVLNFQWKEGVSPDSRDFCIQIEFVSKSKTRVINYNFTLAGRNVIEAYSLNDEAYFYIQLSKILKNKNVGRLLDRQAQRIMEEIDEDCGQQNSQIIPRNLTNFFMYTFMLRTYDQKGELGSFLKENLLREGLETLCKKIYPKTYDFTPKIKSLKFKSDNFSHSLIRVVDNGTFIGIVIGKDVQRSELLNIFGTVDPNQLENLYELPELGNESNREIIDLITLLRDQSQLYYLPLKILFYDTEEFHAFYGEYFYDQAEHRRYFLRLLRNIRRG